MESEGRPWHASIIKVACGLGKTLSAILALYAMNRHKQARDREELARDPRHVPHYKPTLILVPSPSVDVWIKDFDRFFPGVFTLHMFYGTETSIKDTERQKILVTPGTIARLNEIEASLDPTNPQVRALLDHGRAYTLDHGQ
jgi:SNF2 family DNA or RNA helicase